jgi:urease accessory protein UreF
MEMFEQKQLALSDPAEWLGDWHPLAEQLGSADGLLELSSISRLLQIKPIVDEASLIRFLFSYQEQILLPVELPAIQAAHGHAAANELRELVALDCHLAEVEGMQPFAGASKRVGQAQLRKLRPLRDSRLVRRYLEAVETGRAHAWHTMVYGVTLALYSLPLRQGLLGFSYQIMRGFIYSAAKTLELSEKQCRAIYNEVCQDLPARVEATIKVVPVAAAN